MTDRFWRLGGLVAVLMATHSLTAVRVPGQTSPTGEKAVTGTRPVAPGALPRTPDGHPDLQGTYDLATLTPLERPPRFAGRPTLTPEEAESLEKAEEGRRQRRNQPSRPDREAPPVGGDGSTGAAGNVGGYNSFWLDPGTRYVVVNGERRTSILVDPPDGRIPPLTAEARRRNAARRAALRPDADETAGGGGRGSADDPEQRALGERCILGFGSTSGPPALPVLYNNLHQIVQTRDHVVILSEMNHDARIVRMNAPHLPGHVRQWMGDSVGHWEGDTLVVDTTNFTGKTSLRGSGESLHVIERFTRVDARTLLYRFTIDDPTTFTRRWSGEYPWPATDDRLYEYACHEGNYSLGNILRGARQEEKEGAGAARRKR